MLAAMHPRRGESRGVGASEAERMTCRCCIMPDIQTLCAGKGKHHMQTNSIVWPISYMKLRTWMLTQHFFEILGQRFVGLGLTTLG